MKNTKIYIVLFLLLYIGFSVYLSFTTVFWEDELYSLNTTSGNISYTLEQSYNFEAQPPVYFLLLNLWRSIDHHAPFARLLSLLFALGAAWFVFKLSRKMLNEKHAVWIALLFLVNPFVFRFTLEIRLYSLLFFLAAASMYYFYKAFLEEEGSPKTRSLLIYLLIGVLGIFTQYFFTFLLMGQAITILLMQDFRKFLRMILFLVPLALIFSVNFLFILPQTVMHTDNTPVTGTGIVLQLIRSIQNYLFSVDLLKTGKLVRKIPLLVFLFWLFLHFRRHKFSLKDTLLSFQKGTFLLPVIIVVFGIFLVIFSVSGLYFFNRYMAILFPPLFLFFGVLLFPEKSRLNLFVFLGVLPLLSLRWVFSLSCSGENI